MSSFARVAVLLAVVSVIIPFALAGEPPSTIGSDKEYDFGSKVAYLVTKPKDAKSESGYVLYEKVKVIRLADRAFLVGQVPDYGEGPAYKAALGKKVWTPISEIVQITEFATVEEANQYFAAASKQVDKADR